MIRLPTSSTLTDTLLPYSTLFRSRIGRSALDKWRGRPYGAQHADAAEHVKTESAEMTDTGSNLDRVLVLEMVRVTEAAAIAAAKLIGRGDEKAADAAAVEAMRTAFNTLYMDGTIVIGEGRSEEHTSELQSLMRISYAVFCLKKK